jgi:hypothetical protein
MGRFTIILSLLLFAASASTQIEGNPANFCRGGFFTRESDNFQIGIVKAPPRTKVYFYGDDNADCPESEKCKLRAYVVPGDEVIISKTRGNFSCAWFTNKSGVGTVSWIKTENLRMLETDRPTALADWLGEWRYEENNITFTNNKLAGFLNVTGDALWKGLGDNVHIGELDGRFEPKDGELNYSDGDDEYDCKASMQLVGRFLIVSDNNHCGGANVTFSGIYRRTRSYK